MTPATSGLYREILTLCPRGGVHAAHAFTRARRLYACGAATLTCTAVTAWRGLVVCGR